HYQRRQRTLHHRNRNERDGNRRLLRLPEPDPELRRLDVDWRLGLRRAYGACGGGDSCRTVRRVRGGLRIDGGVLAIRDRNRRRERHVGRPGRSVRATVRADPGWGGGGGGA